jgi:Zn-dependent peptidase ImmA (M78 family)
LAELIGVTDRSISGFESGEIQPGDATLLRLSDALCFPTRFFSAPDLDEISEEAASFRALRKMTASQAAAALAAGNLALALNDWIAERFRLPDSDVPKFAPGVDPETAAEMMRVEWKLGKLPVANMIHLLEAHGARVFSLAEECREVDAFSFWRLETPFVFLNTQKSAEHSRMDAAHELGHLVLHGQHEIVRGNRKAEREAQAFASAFLMPRSSLLASVHRTATLDELMQLKRRWLVSLSGFVYRLHVVGVLTDWQYHSLFVEISKRGYRTTEPNAIGQETSQVLNKVFRALRKEGVTKSDLAASLHILPRDLEALVFGLALLPVDGLGEGGTGPQVNPLRLVKKRSK